MQDFPPLTVSLWLGQACNFDTIYAYDYKDPIEIVD